MPTVPDLESIPDDQLLASVRKLAARSNIVLAELLAHLGEVEARGIHRLRACASLYAYCFYELRMSEDAAFRRAKAARLVHQFPELFERIAKGELHLTGLLMLGPHLDRPERTEILDRAKFRSKREIQQLISRIDPKPPVRGLIVPLGPAPARFTTDLRPDDPVGWPVRELREGERPADWIADDRPTDPRQVGQAQLQDAAAGTPTEASFETGAPAGDTGREPIDLRPIRYKVQFTATQEYVDEMNEALDLLSHELKSRDVAELHARAMKALVAALRKKKRAETDRPRSAKAEARIANGGGAETPSADGGAEETRRADGVGAKTPRAAPAPARQPKPPKPSRHIPAAVRREVWARDDGRCAYVDDQGRRCAETARLEIHHRHAHGKGGEATAENLQLRCRPHNHLAAELDFGREHMAWARGELIDTRAGAVS